MGLEDKKSAKTMYVVGQRQSGIQIGDTVRVIKKARGQQDGWGLQWTQHMDSTVGKEYVVERGGAQEHYGFKLKDTSCTYPYFVLQITKKANGASLPLVESQIKGVVMLTQYDAQINVEVPATDKLTAETGILVERYSFFASTREKAIDRIKMEHGAAIITAEDAGNTVLIVCCPFCNRS